MTRHAASKPQEIPTGRMNLTWTGEIILALVVFLTAMTLTTAPVLLPLALTVTLAAALYLGRHRLIWHIHTSRIKRNWYSAAPGTRIGRIRRVPAGESLDVRILPGGAVKQLEARAGPTGELAAAMRVGEVRIRKGYMDAARANAVLVRRDPFVTTGSIPWPQFQEPELSLWNPVQIGLSDEGGNVSIDLLQQSILIGGVSGSGKSTMLNLIIAAAAKDPLCEQWLFDGKEEIEFTPWAPVARRVIGSSPADAFEALREVKAAMNARLRILKANGKRMLTRNEELPLYLVVIDELTCYLNEMKKSQASDFEELLRAVVSRGRAAGLIPLVATHKPQHNLIDTSLRDLFTYRIAFRCTTPQASDTILGQGNASNGYDASTIGGGQRGVGYLLAEDQQPQRIKGFHLTDDDVAAIAQSAPARTETTPEPPETDD